MLRKPVLVHVRLLCFAVLVIWPRGREVRQSAQIIKVSAFFGPAKGVPIGDDARAVSSVE